MMMMTTYQSVPTQKFVTFFKGLGRIRSFSEDRKLGRWLPEDQWAVRQPGSTCPDPCEKSKKPPKPSKSWLSVCKDPEVPLECDIRHNNCPPPPVKPDGPWYSLDNLLPKKKPSEKTPPPESCREKLKQRELCPEEEEVCENIVDKTIRIDIPPKPSDCRGANKEPCPAPVITLSCPPPKELNLTLWCSDPIYIRDRIPQTCQSDKLPYEEFRPKKTWKPAPFSLSNKIEQSQWPSSCSTSPVAYSEFKQVEIPRPLYTRYKSVELHNSNFLMTMIDAKCPETDNYSQPKTETKPCVERCPPPPSYIESVKEPPKSKCPPEKPFIVAGSCKPVKLKKTTKHTFRPKPSNIIEKCIRLNPFSSCKCDDNLQFREEVKKEESKPSPAKPKSRDPPKVITGTLTDEPQSFQGSAFHSHDPPRWMYNLCKPGIKQTPLVPPCETRHKEPDWCSETDGLNFYDDNNEGLRPKPPPDPYKPVKKQKLKPTKPPTKTENVVLESKESEEKFVLMPEKYNIRKMRKDDYSADVSEIPTFEKFLEVQKGPSKQGNKSYPPIKENILYDLQRICPNPPFNPAKQLTPCVKPSSTPECPKSSGSRRSYSTLTQTVYRNSYYPQFYKIQHRTDCGDSSEKCKIKSLQPKRECPEKKKVRTLEKLTFDIF